jgi:ammonia channel protein AmtB
MLEAGAVSAKNTQNIMLKNVFDASLACLIWWGVGQAFAYDGGSGFIGYSPGKYFFANGLEGDLNANWAFFWFEFTFAACAATIVSGAVAERTMLPAYLIFSSFITAFIFPVVCASVRPACLCAKAEAVRNLLRRLPIGRGQTKAGSRRATRTPSFMESKTSQAQASST